MDQKLRFLVLTTCYRFDSHGNTVAYWRGEAAVDPLTPASPAVNLRFGIDRSRGGSHAEFGMRTMRIYMI